MSYEVRRYNALIRDEIPPVSLNAHQAHLEDHNAGLAAFALVRARATPGKANVVRKRDHATGFIHSDR